MAALAWLENNDIENMDEKRQERANQPHVKKLKQHYLEILTKFILQKSKHCIPLCSGEKSPLYDNLGTILNINMALIMFHTASEIYSRSHMYSVKK